MASWTNQSTNNLLPGEPWTSAKALAAFENPVAIAEGASGAPKIDPIAAMAHGGVAGAVGTYVFARALTSNVIFGSTAAGSDLRPTSAAWQLVQASTGTFTLSFGSALTGTWRCMGVYDPQSNISGGTSLFGATLWLRIL